MIMAPPTPVLSRDNAQFLIKKKHISLTDISPETLKKENCKLKSLTQYECSYDYKNDNIICLPFKRLFKTCQSLDNFHQLVEVTNNSTNHRFKNQKKDAIRYLKAEKDLKEALVNL
ncbi:Som1p ASCRUDRAFT_6530 [Ascoidea rubescens DSM 1968]|uniref:Uncharacterized protein n=1 Tax=Ascoidea rubescens DSM 1968 TaxID=1344418 RepID=A0A1D2VMR6_9ASCO|nr:hypothetical protein ASCRUDRAFT_6530 [Ascoidea rubescens DSM 1968]ODV62908.1 hypothetical protein ASCRUDRAFT_6530 [Ascoidea rubescens DSM 1968]